MINGTLTEDVVNKGIRDIENLKESIIIQRSFEKSNSREADRKLNHASGIPVIIQNSYSLRAS